MINIFEENYYRNYTFEYNQSMHVFGGDNQDFSNKCLSGDFLSFDQSIEIENKNMINSLNNGKEDDNVNQIQDKTTAFF